MSNSFTVPLVIGVVKGVLGGLLGFEQYDFCSQFNSKSVFSGFVNT